MGSASKSGPNVPVRRSPKASSQGTCVGRTSPRERRDAASSRSVAMWKYGLGNTEFMSGATGFPVSTRARSVHGAIIKAAPAATMRTGFQRRCAATKSSAPATTMRPGSLMA